MQLVGPLKNTSAAKKMVSLAASSKLVGVGRGREVRLQGILVSLSLVMFPPINAYPKNSANPAAQNHNNECRGCPLISTPTHSVLANCSHKGKEEYCTFNGTQYVKCKWGKKMICYDLKARHGKGQSETFAHIIQKRNANQTPLPTCGQCNRSGCGQGENKSLYLWLIFR